MTIHHSQLPSVELLKSLKAHGPGLGYWSKLTRKPARTQLSFWRKQDEHKNVLPCKQVFLKRNQKAARKAEPVFTSRYDMGIGPNLKINRSPGQTECFTVPRAAPTKDELTRELEDSFLKALKARV